MSRTRMIRWGVVAVLAGVALATFTDDAQALGRRGRFFGGGSCYNYNWCWNPCNTGCQTVCDPCGGRAYVTAFRGCDPCGSHFVGYGTFSSDCGSGCEQGTHSGTSGQTFHEGASPSPSNQPTQPTQPAPPAPPAPGNTGAAPAAPNPPAGENR